ncbi:hypothetical protein Taqua_01776 [Tepidimonas aquatica]|uniref:Uncharacterized protein n=1 Tax=Tepidimonas aquatica TaxID=247482 RepID=A0A554WIV2_9BURK|nr:hypothetical protein Taqua_01776 [Tepidimonas aquatica]
MLGEATDGASSAEELRQELHELMRRLRIEHLKARETELLARAAHDPAALADYRRVQAERRALLEGEDAV